MNAAQFKCLGVFSIFAVIGFGPISPGCLIGMFIVMTRPSWFWYLAHNVYGKKPASELQQGNALTSILLD